jgi:hypothetical protein
MEALFALFTFGITEQFFTFQQDVFPCKQNRVYIDTYSFGTKKYLSFRITITNY